MDLAGLTHSDYSVARRNDFSAAGVKKVGEMEMKSRLWGWGWLGCAALSAEQVNAQARTASDHNSFAALCVAFCIVVGYSWWRSRQA
jgi:hypothetical protein